MVAVEFDDTIAAPGTASRVSQACLKNGLLLLTTSIYETLRFMPPLTLSADECQLGLKKFEDALNDSF